jgi:hypothetical protein
VLTVYGFSEKRCPLATTPYSNALNSAVASIRLSDIEQPEATVMVFDADALAENASGGKEWLVKRHYGGGRAGFIAGRSRNVGRPYDRVGWIWKPVEASQSPAKKGK